MSASESEHQPGGDVAREHLVEASVDVVQAPALRDDLGPAGRVQREHVRQVVPGADDRGPFQSGQWWQSAAFTS
jgi:hypothetical protein